MDHLIQVNHDLNIIVVRAPAAVVAEDVFEAMAKVEQVARENNFDKVLLDLRGVTALPPMIDLYEIVTSHPRHLWAAVLIQVTGTFEKDFDFYETVARNRGRTTRVFGSEDEAIEWLKQMG
jgi:hypothetical protein